MMAEYWMMLAALDLIFGRASPERVTTATSDKLARRKGAELDVERCSMAARCPRPVNYRVGADHPGPKGTLIAPTQAGYVIVVDRAPDMAPASAEWKARQRDSGGWQSPRDIPAICRVFARADARSDEAHGCTGGGGALCRGGGTRAPSESGGANLPWIGRLPRRG